MTTEEMDRIIRDALVTMDRNGYSIRRGGYKDQAAYDLALTLLVTDKALNARFYELGHAAFDECTFGVDPLD